MRRLLILVCVSLSLSTVLATSSARADTFGRRADSAPSMFDYAFRGLGLGLVVGGSTAYVIGRSGDWERSDWRTMGYGLGFGALGGAGLGLTMGAIDLGSDRPGRAAIALRDATYGAGLGALLGAAGGGISAIAQDDAEHILFGTAVGALAGAGTGFVIGIIEGNRITESPAHARHILPSFAATRDANRSPVLLAGAVGRF